MELLLENQYGLELSPGSGSDTKNLKTLLTANPDQHFIMQDCANPDARQAPSKTWETNIRDLAKNPNLSCKLSGLFTTGNRKTWKPADFYPFLDILFDSFGSGRILFASDWPFLLLSGMYVQWKSLIEKFMEKYSEEDRDKVFGDNARGFYKI
jgi:L-fuconolactonase